MSKNDNLYYAGTTTVAVKVMGRNTQRAKSWGILGASENRRRGCGRDVLG